ncbi:MAG: hypothetical protein K8S56_00660 [Candidatus Cloacimonetes bacterium]|nr:hypothetical protein [Candidatus Cloacimonadota bacterium]
MSKLYILVGLVLLVLGCSYSVHMTAYPHLKSLHIGTFENKSTEYSLEEELLESLTGSFKSSNQLKLVDLAPDCRLDGEIVDYTNKIYSYDSGEKVKEYELKILFNIQLTDLIQNEVLYEKENLLLKEVYLSEATASSGTQATSEEAARSMVFDDLYQTIMENSFQSW